ncbi:MAG: C10 family peptidase [Muribaculaceae bacterium]|nr:C10 family peptidase [Muribaculaceae bacterium]
MNRLVIFIILSVAAFTGYSKQISEQEAYDKAQQVLKGKRIKESPIPDAIVFRAPSSKNIHVFNAEDNGGFVIISGDDRIRSILGYSDTGSIDLENLPCNVHWLLDGYESTISSLQASETASSLETITQNSVSDRPDIPALLSTEWGQNAPFNNNCPILNGQHCLTGCVATAMAQIINYHKWPLCETAEIPGYTTFTNKIILNQLPPKEFNWEDMNDQELADLMLYCGQSVNMNYGLQESATSSTRVPHALTDLFNFSKGALDEERKYYSNEEWIELIYDQLKNKYPVFFRGEGHTGSSHAFIVDGYENGLFHVNWGWNGNYNGYFSLDDLNPTVDSSYSLNQEMISYICPPAKVEDTTKSKIVVHNITCSQSHIQRTDKNAAFPPVRISAILASDLTINADVQIGFAMYDGDEIVKVLLEESCLMYPSDNDLNHYEDIIFPADIPVGSYRLMAVNRMTDDEGWLPDSKSHARYIDVSITDNDISFQPVKKGNDGVENINYGYPIIDGLKYRLVSEYDTYRAYLQPLDAETDYPEEIFIPDYVEYDTFRFKVFGEEGYPFLLNNRVTSISSPVSLNISGCSNLESIEFREGVLNTEKIYDCPKLKKISYPASCRVIQQIGNCPSLSEISYQNLYPLEFMKDESGMILSEQYLPALSDVYFHGDEPPLIENGTISSDTAIRIHIIQGLKDAYIVCGWPEANIVEDIKDVAESVKWDYIGYDEDCDDGILAYSSENDVELAMKITSEEFKNYIGCKIVAIEYFSTKTLIQDNYAKNPDYVFITEKDKDYVIKQPTEAVRGSWTRVTLETAYEISGEDIFVGVGRHGRIHMNWANYDTCAGGFWYRAMGTDYSQETPGLWEHNCGDPDLNFPMPIRAIIQGDNLPSDIAVLEAEYVINKEKPLSDEGTISLKIRNRSPRLIKNIDFDLCYDGKLNETVSVSLLLPANHDGLVKLNPKNKRFNTHVIDLDLEKIDGTPDAVQSNSNKSLQLLSSDLDHYPRVTVMENYTSAKNGSCVRGIALKDYMKTNYPDNYLVVSIHDNDEMNVQDDSYDEFLKKVTEPYFEYVNRSEWNIGLPFDVKNLKDSGEALVRSEAEYSKDGRINIVTNTSFSLDHDENEGFTLAYVLLEDQVGPFMQVNNYSRPNADENPNDYMDWWYHQENKVTYEFNDVARTIQTYEGIDNLFPKNVVKDEVYEASYCMKIPDYVQNCENLKVVTLLINKNSGEIINADSSRITGVIPDMSFELGDSNGNGEINIADAVNIANFVVGNEVEKFHYTASDVNNDGSLTFADAAATVTLILGQPVKAASVYKKVNTATLRYDTDRLYVDNVTVKDADRTTISLSLDNIMEYVALQADLILPEGMVLDDVMIGKRLESSHKLTFKHIDQNTIRIILFDLSNPTIIESNDPILEIIVKDHLHAGEIELTNIIASDSMAHDHWLIFDKESCDVPTSDYKVRDNMMKVIPRPHGLNVTNSKSKRIEISSIDGRGIVAIIAETEDQRIDLPSGIYIIKVDNVCEKVIVK